MRRAAAIVLGAVVLAGCGGDADATNEYVGQVNAAQSGLTQKFTSLSSRVTRVSEPEADAAVLREYEAAVDRAVAELKAIEPPGEVKGVHLDLVQTTASYAAAIADARTVFERQDAQQIIKAQTDLNSAITETTGRVNDLTAKINRTLRK